MLALGIDVGSSTTKVVLVDVDVDRVREVATRTAATPSDVQSLLDVIDAACRALTADGAEVMAVGVASMAETGAPIGADGDALTDLLRWDDGLGAADADELQDLAPEVFARSGVRLSAKTPLMTWRWLRRERPEVWERMACWLGVADLAVHGLTGERVTDHTLAGRTGGYRLAAPGRATDTGFDVSLLSLAGMARDRLPRVARAREIAGRLSSDAAARTGLPVGVPVVVAGHDHQVAAWAAGARAAGDVADSLGTAEAVLTVLARRPALEHVRAQGMSLVRTVSGQDDAVVAGSSSAGAMLDDWLSSLPEADRESVLAQATKEHTADGEPTGAPVAPYLRGRQSPDPDPRATPGRPPADWPLERQARAVVEGLCYQARWMISSQLAQEPPQRVAVIGGERLPGLWTALKRATLPWPVTLVRTAEPVAAGAAVLALARSGALGEPGAALLTAPVLDAGTEAPPGWDRHADAYAAFVQSVGAALPPLDGSSGGSAAVD